MVVREKKILNKTFGRTLTCRKEHCIYLHMAYLLKLDKIWNWKLKIKAFSHGSIRMIFELHELISLIYMFFRDKQKCNEEEI